MVIRYDNSPVLNWWQPGAQSSVIILITIRAKITIVIIIIRMIISMIIMITIMIIII